MGSSITTGVTKRVTLRIKPSLTQLRLRITQSPQPREQKTSSRFCSVCEIAIKEERPHVPFTGLHLKSLSLKKKKSTLLLQDAGCRLFGQRENK